MPNSILGRKTYFIISIVTEVLFHVYVGCKNAIRQSYSLSFHVSSVYPEI